ncbi:cobalamin-binding protein [Thiomicrospira microaerophila]|uniref:cobalamin-binding protein n=1 Tax=Thiomicrospira microaerophila TaxID=406020 RepID=UPI001E469C65|nr:cobalamin-binding protein [Thiomicrospira microaerophila]
MLPRFQRRFWLIISLALFSQTLQAQPIETAQRIISLAPSLTELVYSAGAGAQLVGVVHYSDYPEDALNKPRIGRYNALNFERIIELNPDLILAWASGNKPQDIARLQHMGFKVLVRDTQKLADIPRLIAEIGHLTGNSYTANAEAQRLKDQLSQLSQDYQHASPIRVFYQVWHQPLITVNGEQFIGQAIRLCGGVNIFADQAALAPQVSREAVIKANPNLILLGGMGDMQQAWLGHWQAIPFLQASQNQHITSLNADQYQRPTARLIDGLASLCQLIDQVRQANQSLDYK